MFKDRLKDLRENKYNLSLTQYCELLKKCQEASRQRHKWKICFGNLISVAFGPDLPILPSSRRQQQEKRRSERPELTPTHPTVHQRWHRSVDREAKDQVDKLPRWIFTTHSNSKEEATGQRPELKPTHPTESEIDLGKGRLKIKLKYVSRMDLHSSLLQEGKSWCPFSSSSSWFALWRTE